MHNKQVGKALAWLASASMLFSLVPAAAVTSTAFADDTTTATQSKITNGEPLYADDGTVVDAHGGGFYKDDDGTYYWVGEGRQSNTAGNTQLKLYSSKDLMNWHNEGVVVDGSTVHELNENYHPEYNAKGERSKIVKNSKGEWIIWAHWETNASYGSSKNIVFKSTTGKASGPYKVVSKYTDADGNEHLGGFRPGAGNDYAEAMGNRIGQLVPDWDTQDKDGNYGTLQVPATDAYPETIKQWTGINASNPDDFSWDTSGGYGTSEAGNWWTYEFNDIKQPLDLMATAVRMTPYDTSAYDQAKAEGASPSTSYIKRYPAAKSDNNKAAGVSAAGYKDKLGQAAENDGIVSNDAESSAYDPNTKDNTIPKLDDVDESTPLHEYYNIVVDYNNVSGTSYKERGELKAPLISPQVSENTGVNKDNKNVVVRPKDRAFITAQQGGSSDAEGATIWATNDGSDPTDPNNANRWSVDNRWSVQPIEIKDGMTLKAASERDGKYSPVSSTTFTIADDTASQEYKDVPVFQPVANRKGTDTKDASGKNGTYNTFGYQELRIYSPSFGAEVYYTMDGQKPVAPRYGWNSGYGSRDYTIYQDPVTNKNYLVTAQDHIYMRVWELNDDLTDVVPTKEYSTFRGEHLEAPTLVRGPQNKYVYLVMSGQSGWKPNQSVYTRITNLGQPFDEIASGSLKRESFGDYNGVDSFSPRQPFGDSTTYATQPIKILNLGTADNPSYVYLGDRWNETYLDKSMTIWMPLTIDDDALGTGGKINQTACVPGDKEDANGCGLTSDNKTISGPVYKASAGKMTLSYVPYLSFDVANGKVIQPSDEKIKIDPNEDPDDPDGYAKKQYDPDNTEWTDENGNPVARVIDKSPSGERNRKCDFVDNQKNNDNQAWYTCSAEQDPDGLTAKYGIVHRNDVATVFDGNDFDVDSYDLNEAAFKGTGNDFYITMDLGQKRDLTQISMSFKSVGGSDNAHRYFIYATNDTDKDGKPINWKEIVDNGSNLLPGFQAHNLTNASYRYIQFHNRGNFDVAHGKGADWSRGLYELNVRANKLVNLKVTDLATNINQATALASFTGRYTEDSLKTLNDALTPAQTLLDEIKEQGTETTHTQDEVDAANAELDAAIKGLVMVGATATVSTDGLKQTVAIGTDLLDKTDVYTADSLAGLKAAVDEGNEVLAKTDTTQDEVDAATTKITDAIKALAVNEPAPAELQLEALQSAITLAGKVNDDDYTAESVQALTDAAATAQKVLDAAQADGSKTTQAEVDKATADVLDAYGKLEKKAVETVTPNYSGVQRAINDANAILANADAKDLYTEKSLQDLSDAVARAEETMKDVTDAKDQQKLDDAAKAITNAIESLKKKDEQPTTSKPDFSKLDQAIKESEKRKASDYTADSWKQFQSALDNAKQVRANATSQQAVEDALAKLSEAACKLVPGAGNNNGASDDASKGNGSKGGKLGDTGSDVMSIVVSIALLVMGAGATIALKARRSDR